MNDVPTPTPGASPDLDAPTVVDLAAGSAHITPVDGGTRYSVALPSAPLTDDDLQDLTIALHAVTSGPAILVDVDEYAGGDCAGDEQRVRHEHVRDEYAGTE